MDEGYSKQQIQIFFDSFPNRLNPVERRIVGSYLRGDSYKVMRRNFGIQPMKIKYIIVQASHKLMHQ